MLAKNLFHKASPKPKGTDRPTMLFLWKFLTQGSKTITNLDLQVVLHYGIPYTASILAFDPIQRLLAIGTLDGRIKIIGGDNIEGLLISPKKLPFKNIEFLQNQGLLIAISNDNDIQVWDLEWRKLAYSLQWETNITAFAVIHGTFLMYIGDEVGLLSVLRYDSEEGKILRLPYIIPAIAIIESAGISCPNHQSIVGILPQPSSSGTRVLVAFENGLIILWDVSERCVITVRGYTELQLKGEASVNLQTQVGNELEGNTADNEQEDKEICSLCWVSDCGSLLAVGYINGDILLWDISSESSTKRQRAGLPSKAVVKLQLASGNRRLPVIVLNWSANAKADERGGQLLIYGGDDMGSEEVLTVLNLEWSSGIDSLRCISRVDLNLNGSFADMILVPTAGATEHSSTSALFVLTNPGQVNVYDGSLLPSLKTEEGKFPIQPDKFPVAVPTIDPCITVTKICLLSISRNSAQDLLEKACARGNATTPTLSGGTRWPVTGGVPNEFLSRNNGIERVYITGYEDGSVRIWNATSPILTLMFILESKLPGIELEDRYASVSTLDFCPISMSLAVGNERGLVCVYELLGSTKGSSFHVVSESNHEVHSIEYGEGYHCTVAFMFLTSPIRTLKFLKEGKKLAAGLETGQVAMLDMSSSSIMFRTDCLSGPNVPVISIALHINPHISAPFTGTKQPNVENPEHSAGVMLILTKDAKVFVIDSITGKVISSQPMHLKKESSAVSMYVIDRSSCILDMASDKDFQHPSEEKSAQHDHHQADNLNRSQSEEVEQHGSSDALDSSELLVDRFLLLCCEDALWLCPLKSVMQGNNNSCYKENLVKKCCWSAMFKKKDEKGCGLVLLYQTGDLEMRSLPDFEVLAQSSLMSTLRWSFKTNMEKTISSYDNGQITMVNGSELAFVSLLACENDFGLPESLPCLHDKVLAAATDAAVALSTNQKKKQVIAPGILGGFLKGLKGGRVQKDVDAASNIDKSSLNLDSIFSRDPFAEPSAIAVDDNRIDLSIDDIEVDDVLPVVSTTSTVNKDKKKNENAEREKLFHGATKDTKPRVRTTQEIMTQYRFDGDASAAAAHAREKLAQRQERLEKLNERTAELQDNAQNFASLANELVRTMEKKKWWQI